MDNKGDVTDHNQIFYCQYSAKPRFCAQTLGCKGNGYMMREFEVRVWFQDDIANNLQVLQTTLYAISVEESVDSQHAAYKSGFETALQCVARSFGFQLTLVENVPILPPIDLNEVGRTMK